MKDNPENDWGFDIFPERQDDSLKGKEPFSAQAQEIKKRAPAAGPDDQASDSAYATENKERGPSEAGRKNKRRKNSRGSVRLLIFILLLGALATGGGAGLGLGYYLWGWEPPYDINLKAIETPDWIQQKLIRKNIFSRPDVTMKQVRNIVVHYVGNPNTSAEANRLYFDGLADQDPSQPGASASSHFVVGLEGEIIQCVPLGEITYANAPRNFDTVTIEVCHPDETGKFNEASYASLVRLTAWLCQELELSPDDVIRHYDVSGKSCPKYFVEHEDAWKQFRKDVGDALRDR